jgi:hypothetical protein
MPCKWQKHIGSSHAIVSPTCNTRHPHGATYTNNKSHEKQLTPWDPSLQYPASPTV